MADLVSRIFRQSDLASRKSLRGVNRLLSQIGQRDVFHTASVQPTDESCDRFESILDRPDLAAFDTKLYFHIFDLERCNCVCDRGDDAHEETGLPVRFSNLLDRLKEFPCLQRVVLHFHRDATWEISEYVDTFARVRDANHECFASLPQPLQDLAIRELQDINTTDATVVADTAKVLSSLNSQRLNITSEHREYPGELDYPAAPHVFFLELPSVWLKPTTANLRHLTIYSSIYCGFYPKLNWSGIHFPPLKSLALGNHGFVHDSQLEWILSHAATLSDLYLDDCGIVDEVAIADYERTLLDPALYKKREGLRDNLYASYSKRWVDYFRAFKDGLSHLRRFHYDTPFETETTIRNQFHEESYMVFCDGFGPSPYMTELIYRENGPVEYRHGERVLPSEADKEAFREICAKLGQEIPDLEDYDY
ncbi:hypothetical protein BJX70DRAFT_389444 [Aspergillus crustosus]